MSERGDATAPILLSHGRFRDFDHLSEATRGWDLDFRQVDRGGLDAELLQVGVGTVVVMRLNLNRRFDQRGGAPAGLRTFALPEETVAVEWCGHPVSDTHLPAFSRGGEFHAVSPPGFGVHTVSMPEELLDDVARTLDLGSVPQLVDGAAGATRCDEKAVRQYRAALRQVCEVVTGDPGMLESAGLQEELQFEIPAKLLMALSSSRAPLDPPAFSARALALQRALPYIERHRDGPLTVREVCRAAGVSWRTLVSAFRERFGVTPKAYLTAMRLDGVRRDLVPGQPPVKIADVANRWGFWHMGQFAADYRKQFGELPSETLRRRSGGSARTTG
jgi:AraC family ethanolamine operon transcriptional activator